MHRPQKVNHAKVRRRLEEQDNGMRKGQRDSKICRPLMQRKHIPVPMRPLPNWTIAQGDEQSQEQVYRGGSRRAQPKVRTKI